ncbi:MAG TPA: PEP/pyruvate-binding domain-containing protein [Myxococcales bacterium]|jgi:pyruvate,water dikinase
MITSSASAGPAPVPVALEVAGPVCIPLSAIGRHAVGGKAAGLARLVRAGLEVPAGFVIVGAERGRLPENLAESYLEHAGGGAVAVRSSALAEDGAAASYAGQFATFLDVRGEPALRDAVERCLASLESVRADAYRQEREGGARTRMCVVVQAMVEARAAGVLFTADPMTGRRDRLVIDAVKGCGEALVSGKASPDHYQLTPAGEVVRRDLSGVEPLLSEAELRELASGALKARDHFGTPLDMEWALGPEGRVHWLQARPITALPADPHEFDSPAVPGDLYTSSNIGECMPGAITPLSWSTVWLANDHGVQFMFWSSGVQKQPPGGYRTTRQYLGHIFFDLTEMAQTSRSVLGASDLDLGLAICGRVVPELHSGEKKPIWVRMLNTFRYVRTLFSGSRHAQRLEQLVAQLAIPERETAAEQLAEIDAKLPRMLEACDRHIAACSLSGAMGPALMQTLAKGKVPTEEHHAQAAELLAAVSGHDVESAGVVSGIDRLVGLLEPVPGARARFVEASAAAALQWLRTEAGEAAARELEELLARHGHHCLREFELREKEWATDPLPLIASLQVALRARLANPAGAGARRPRANVPAPKGSLGWLARMAQKGVRQRERTKSLLVKVVVAFKRAYRRLGDLLVKEGRLPDADLVFFLTPAELDLLSRGEAGNLAELAAARRRAQAYQSTLCFPDVFTGSPEPLGAGLEAAKGDGVLHGKPVSRGKVTGLARVANSLAEAADLRPGEILISPVTDIGWTPYFSLIAGLATDVGSSISHGAVVAREYGLPAVVDLRVATRTFQTGDRVELDGDHGTLRKVE